MPVTWDGNWRASLCASCGRAWAPWAAWARCGAAPLPGSKQFMGVLNQFLSPYQTNPLNINPLRQLLTRVVDFEMLAHPEHPSVVPKLFICATNVRTGGGKIFKGEQVTADAIMASACLPQLFKAVEIDGECYWDGGFSGNPAL